MREFYKDKYRLKGKAFYICACIVTLIPIVFLIALYFDWIAF